MTNNMLLVVLLFYIFFFTLSFVFCYQKFRGYLRNQRKQELKESFKLIKND